MGKKIIVAVTGASGSIYARRLLIRLSEINEQIDRAAIIFSDTALKVWQYELNQNPEIPVFFEKYKPNDFFSPPASGSANFQTMIVCPSSMGCIARIAGGFANDLITRAADVMLKERRQLIVVPREMPYSLIHINNFKTITEAGGIICPASPSFYSMPQTIEQLADTVIDRVLHLAGFNFESFEWKG